MATASTVFSSSSTTSPPHSTMSTHSTELVKGSHQFTVPGYSLEKRNGSGHRITSGSFEVGGYSWAIHFYAAGSTKEKEGHVSVFLELQSTGVEEVAAKCSFHFNDAAASSLRSTEIHDFKPRTDWGFPEFMEIETVESVYLVNDCLTLHCAFEVVKQATTGATVSRLITVPPPSICRHLEQLLTEQGSDVTFRVGQSKYDAHRAVLAARSPVFSAQFFGPMATSEAGLSEVRIDDMESAVFEAVLHFVYTDTLPHVEEGTFQLEVSSKQEVVRTTVCEWLAAADRFDLVRMALLCETIGVANAAATLQLADRHHRTQLKEFCMDYIASPGMLAAMMATEGFKELKVASPSLLIEILEKLGSCS
uniref:BTB domain-containing protein n=1 Tax=Oryza brachyantha TaxID=4533 RepID=J3MSW2_ORYBR